MKMNNINKSEKFLKTIETEHFANKNEIATGDLKSPVEIVASDIEIQLNDLKNMTKEEAKNIKFSDNSVGYGTSLHEAKKRLLEKGIPEKHIVEKQLFGIDNDPEKVLATRLVIDPEKVYNISKNIIVGDSRTMSFETKGITHSWNNEPYLKGDSGRTPLYPEIIKNVDNNNPIQESETHLLPFGISLSNSLNYVLESFFEKGLEHWRQWDMKKFQGATVRTVSYICNKGYNGPIKIWDDNKFLFEYDFRSLGYIINGGSSQLTDFLVLTRRTNFDNPIYVSSIPKKFYNNYNNIKDSKFLNSIPIVKVNRTNGIKKEDIGYVSADNYDKTDIDKWKIIMGYQPTGSNYGQDIGHISVIEPGMLTSTKYKYQTFDTKEEAMNRKNYLSSNVVNNWVLKRTRTQPTLDASKPRNHKERKGYNQLRFLDNLDPKITIKNDDDILEVWKEKYNLTNNLIKEIKNEIR